MERLHDPFLWAAVKKRLGYFFGALGVLALFGGVGFFAGYVVVTTVRDAYRAENWPQVPAIVEISEGSASYTYAYRGKTYTSDRLGSNWLGGTSDVDDWDERMGAKLAAAQESKQPVMAYVNPEKPSEAMLDHQIRWKLLLFFAPFALGFGGAGAFLSVTLLVKALGWKSRSGNQPRLKPRTREALTQWGFGLLWNGISLPLAIIGLPNLWAEGSYFGMVLLAFFPLFGVLILWSAVVTTWHVLRDGSPFNPGAFEDFSAHR